ncbi:MAG: hypothetical protein MUO26_09400 [Methanotrichaceae archaeon]|nr:hypothetical protein [Methanotrichaceae archaeon]
MNLYVDQFWTERKEDNIIPENLENLEELSILRESGVHGQRWDSIHDNYFSDPAISSPLVEVIVEAVLDSHPTVVADLGGGTGFILKQLLNQNHLPSLHMVNVDISPYQLAACQDTRIVHLQSSLASISREQLMSGKGILMLVARSVLHYYGQFRLDMVLNRLRSQVEADEIFVHQSACFQHNEDAECLNALYGMMGTQKWYPTIDHLRYRFVKHGWEVCSIQDAPMLRLHSRDLADRYNLKAEQVNLIRNTINKKYGQKPNVFTLTDDGFESSLHYTIFKCKAI